MPGTSYVGSGLIVVDYGAFIHVVFSMGVGFTYFSIKSSVLSVVFTYGILAGLGQSIGYIPPMAVVMQVKKLNFSG